MRNRISICGLALLAAASAAAWGQLLPAGPGLRLNSFTLGDQTGPSAATGFQGNTVVVWETPEANGCHAIHGQRLQAGGAQLLGFEIPLSTSPVCDGGPHAVRPKVGVSATSNLFVAAWGVDPVSFDPLPKLKARRLDFFAGPLGDSFLVDDDHGANQLSPGEVAFNPVNDRFAVSWNASFIGTTSPVTDLLGRTYNGLGAPLANPFLVNRGSGEGAVRWGTRGLMAAWVDGQPLLGTPNRVFLRRLNVNGTPAGNVITVSSLGDPSNVGLAVSRNGNVLLAWTAADGDRRGVWAQLFDPLGVARSALLHLNTQTVGSGVRPAVASDGTSFLVAWDDGGDPPQVYGRLLNGAGAAAALPFRVDPFSRETQRRPAVTGGPEGNFLLVWEGTWPGSGEDALDILGQRFATAAALARNRVRSGLASPAAGTMQYFRVRIPRGRKTLRIASAGGTGNADLFIRYGALPTLDQFDLVSRREGNAEAVRIAAPQAGAWYIGVRATAPYTGLSIVADDGDD